MIRFLGLAVSLVASVALAQTEVMCTGQDSSGTTRRQRVDSNGSLACAISGPDGGQADVVASGTVDTTPTGTYCMASIDTSSAATQLKANAGGYLVVEGRGINGQSPPGDVYPVIIGGVDSAGTAKRALSTDASGRPIVVGPVAAGAAATGNPLLCGASDGTNAQYLLVDAVKQLKTAIPAADINGRVTEVAVSNTVTTFMPSTPLTGRRSVELQNLGPNPIYCALGPDPGATPVLTKSRMIPAVSGSWALDITDTVWVTCKAATANQDTGAATIVTELR